MCFKSTLMTLFIVRLLKEELQLLQEPGSYVGEVVKVMGKKKVLVKVRRFVDGQACVLTFFFTKKGPS